MICSFLCDWVTGFYCSWQVLVIDTNWPCVTQYKAYNVTGHGKTVSEKNGQDHWQVYKID